MKSSAGNHFSGDRLAKSTVGNHFSGGGFVKSHRWKWLFRWWICEIQYWKSLFQWWICEIHRWKWLFRWWICEIYRWKSLFQRGIYEIHHWKSLFQRRICEFRWRHGSIAPGRSAYSGGDRPAALGRTRDASAGKWPGRRPRFSFFLFKRVVFFHQTSSFEGFALSGSRFALLGDYTPHRWRMSCTSRRIIP